MGIVAKQTIKGSVWSYLGVLIGFITSTYLYANYLTPEIVGLFGLLIAITTITGSVASLGVNGITSRLFPYFRTQDRTHNGYLFISTIPQIVGLIIFVILYFIFEDALIQNNIEKSSLLVNYVRLIIPLTIFTLIFNYLDTYNQLLYDAVLGAFLQEFFQRFLILLVVLLFAFKFISIDQLVYLYVFAVCAKALIIFFFLYFRGEISFKPNLAFIDKKFRKEMINVAFYYIIGGLGSLVVFNIDKIVINQLLDLKNTGVYTIAFYFGTLVIIPSRLLLKIAGTLIADAWKQNDLKKIKDIYYKSCINQFLIGGFLFLGIWANIDNILMILGPDYAESKWVIFFVGLGYLFDMMTGVNEAIIGNSKHYRVLFIFIALLIFIVVGALYVFIPLWGITGAAIAISLALFLNNLMRYIYLWKKFGWQPFNWKFVVVALFLMFLYFMTSLIPQQEVVLDILIRGIVITLLMFGFLYIIPISNDASVMFTNTMNTIIQRISKKKVKR